MRLASADARPLHEEPREIREPIDAGLVEHVADKVAARPRNHLS